MYFYSGGCHTGYWQDGGICLFFFFVQQEGGICFFFFGQRDGGIC